MSIVKTASVGMAFDCNQMLSTGHALAFKNSGYDTCIRYIPRTPTLVYGNLTGVEIEAILAAGLDLCVVQHCPEPNWMATADLGKEYGEYGAAYCEHIGLPKGVSVWLDLEEVAGGSDANGYCRAWFTAVKAAGYEPGIYVGYNPQMSDEALHLLPFEAYWRAYNSDSTIPVRGWQIRQEPQKTLNGIAFDPDVISADALGNLPFVISPS